ncbi:hypothetical protein FSP39_022928 [Pinctada imbricata]|uniref:Uncharacterized protein n=1 Tax=Pinctada imbricata TaxID=66713 RepID=A0AA89C3S8_PINIB|nr:hypothetical protein FSP39_022928 [Pinctada imbricata]
MDKVYVPDPHKWIKYYQGVLDGKNNPYTDRLLNKPQIDKGTIIHDTYKQAIKPNVTTARATPDIQVKLISPSQQVVEQAKDELKPVIKKQKRVKSLIPNKRQRAVKTSSKARSEKKTLNVKKFKPAQRRRNLKKIKAAGKRKPKPNAHNVKKQTEKPTKQFKDIFA